MGKNVDDVDAICAHVETCVEVVFSRFSVRPKRTFRIGVVKLLNPALNSKLTPKPELVQKPL